MFQILSEEVSDTLAVGRAVGGLARAGDVVALDGPLGAGKTQFVRGLAEGLGLDPRHVSSPTFVFVQEYAPDPERDLATPVLVHVDAYRLESSEQLQSIGWSDELLDGAVLAVEWAPRIVEALGPDVLHVRIAHTGEGQRAIEIEGQGAWAERMAGLMERTDRGNEPTGGRA
ncbi:MAG: tRNA (adenosine(37)-N6)-threonylcarbamoyltransferase complex ATPase subunit type 1 TsaE [Planctomycetota bacterium]